MVRPIMETKKIADEEWKYYKEETARRKILEKAELEASLWKKSNKLSYVHTSSDIRRRPAFIV